MTIQFTVNGTSVETDAEREMPLLWVLRDEFRLTGTKFGCGIAQCGACTVHVNGRPRRACVTPIRAVEGATIITIEGLRGKVAKRVQAAWKEIDVPQCGYCQSGQIMSAVALLESNPTPDDAAIDSAMAGNICRCATYARIRRGIKIAAGAGAVSSNGGAE
ncbi:MAG: (2Fe-2S)-binding protein [Myxococcota bacterium]